MDLGLLQGVQVRVEPPIQDRAPPEEGVVSRHVVGGSALEQDLLLRREDSRERGGDLLRNLRLDGEDVRDVPVIGLGPDLNVRAGVNELACHPDPGTRALHTALKDVGDVELGSYLGDGLCRLPVLHD